MSDYVQGVGTRTMRTYRLSSSEITAMETAWTDQAILDTNTGHQDGRCYYNTISSNYVDPSTSGMLEYMDYPYCAVSNTDDWYCQMFLPSPTTATSGYPAFDTPGVIDAYYVSSFIPNSESDSYAKLTADIGSSN